MNDAIALYDDKRWSQRNKTIKYNNLLYHKKNHEFEENGTNLILKNHHLFIFSYTKYFLYNKL